MIMRKSIRRERLSSGAQPNQFINLIFDLRIALPVVAGRALFLNEVLQKSSNPSRPSRYLQSRFVGHDGRRRLGNQMPNPIGESGPGFWGT